MELKFYLNANPLTIFNLRTQDRRASKAQMLPYRVIYRRCRRCAPYGTITAKLRWNFLLINHSSFSCFFAGKKDTRDKDHVSLVRLLLPRGRGSAESVFAFNRPPRNSGSVWLTDLTPFPLGCMSITSSWVALNTACWHHELRGLVG